MSALTDLGKEIERLERNGDSVSIFTVAQLAGLLCYARKELAAVTQVQTHAQNCLEELHALENKLSETLIARSPASNLIHGDTIIIVPRNIVAHVRTESYQKLA